MPTAHTVKQGEHLSRISKTHGFTDFHVVWDHPDNAALKDRRKDPNVLLPGDQLTIPDKTLGEESAQSEQHHRYRVRRPTLTLRLAVLDHAFEPVLNRPATLFVEGEETDQPTDAEGKIERPIDPTAENARLWVLREDASDPPAPPADQHEAPPPLSARLLIDVPILIGHLDPIEERTGVMARLNNLGYDAGPTDQEDELRLRSAVEEFQCDHKLDVDGIPGPKTQSKLKEVHGC